MFFHVFKKILIIFLSTGALILSALVLFQTDSEILIKSLESKTTENKDVFNKIKFIPGLKKDIWMMNQSHHGLTNERSLWDRLAIVVNKDSTKKTVQFYQLPPGELNWDENLRYKAQAYRVSCFMCHSNGPRVIRADESDQPLDLKSKILIGYFNLRIKSYGVIEEDHTYKEIDQNRSVPFRYRSHLDNEILNIKSCTKCHNESGLFSRGFLRRQNLIAIKFMLNNKLMPPLGFSISESDQIKLRKFILGL